MTKALNTVVLSVAEALLAGHTVDPETGRMTTTDEARKAALEAAGLTDVMTQYQAALPLLVAGARIATATAAQPVMKEHKSLGAVASDIKFGTDSLNTKFHRSRESRNPGTGATVVTNWASSSSITSTVTKPNGQNKLAAQYIQEMYAEMSVDA